MPRNLSGVYTLPAGNPVVPGTTIDANWANSTLSDMANEITNSLSRTGAGGMLAPFRIDDGNVTGPGLAFLNETNTGYFRSAAGSTAFSVLGVSTLQINTTSVTVPSNRTLNAQGNALVGGTFGVTGASAFGSTLAVTGAITAVGGVLGNITAASGTSTFADVVITGSLDMTVGSSATITGLSTPVNASDAANKGYVDTQVATRLALAGGTMSGAIAMGTNKITGLGTPTADQDAATKAYVDSVAQGLDVKGSVRAATTGNITLSGAQTIDGVAVIAGDRVLVKDQSTAANNGIYVAAAGAWSRAADADTWAELVGAFVFVEDGTTNDNSGWVCTSPPGGTLGVTAVTFEQFSGAGQINAGTGMTKNGNTLNVNTASSSRIVVGADEIDLAQTGVTAGTYKSVTVDLYGRVTAGTNPTTLAGYGISDAYTTAQTDSLLAQRLALTGGTMTGAIAMSTNRITGMGDPVNAQDAATKNYIDTIFGSTTTAAASAAAAAASASAASTSASNASTSASNAASSASAASTSASNAATSLFNFRAQYLGPLASDPTVDGNGNAVTAGDLYWNTTVNETRIYNGTAWVAAYLPAAGYMDLTTNQTAAGVKTFSSNPILSGGTANGVAYLNGSKVLTTGSALTFDGTTLTAAALVNGANVEVLKASNVGSGDNTQASIGFYAANTKYAEIIGGYSGAPSLKYNATTTIGYHQWQINGSEQARLTSTGLGIGTSSPAYKLDVNGLIRSAGDAANFLLLEKSANTGVYARWKRPNREYYLALDINNNGGNDFSLYDATAGATRWTVDSSGNLGLGVTPSAWAGRALQVSSVTGFAQDANGYAVVSNNAYNDAGSSYRYIISSYASAAYRQAAGVHAWFNAPSGTAGNAISFTQAMTLNASGELLINTTSSTGAKLTVVGDQHIRSGWGLAWFNSGNTGYWAAYNSSDNFIFSNGAERARLSSTGNLLVGTTTDPGGSGAIADANGNVRAIPQSGAAKTTSYTLATTDVGEFIQISTGGSITIPTSTFAAGDVISMFNNTTGNITITCSAPTTYIGGTNTVKTSITLATRGVATVLFITSTLCVVTGNVT